MDISMIGTVLAIVVICYLVGMTAKTIKAIPDEVIPVIVGVVGGLIAIPGMYLIVDFPANDIINAIAVGITSGLASTGVNQVWKQNNKRTEDEDAE